MFVVTAALAFYCRASAAALTFACRATTCEASCIACACATLRHHVVIVVTAALAFSCRAPAAALTLS